MILGLCMCVIGLANLFAYDSVKGCILAKIQQSSLSSINHMPHQQSI
jgi:hypothetical protein